MDGEQPPEQRFDLELDKAQLGTARRALMLDDLSQMLATSRAAKESHNRTHLPNYQTPEEPVIHIGDIHNEANGAQGGTPKRSGLSPLMSGLIGAGLLASGIGIPAAGYFIADAIKNMKPGQTVTTPGDGNTQYSLKLLP